MKLNEKGKALADKWYGIYRDEIHKIREETNDPGYDEGWCVIDDYDHIRSVEDECGVLLQGYDDNAFYMVLETGIKLDEKWNKFCTTRELLLELAKYMDMEDDEDMMAVINLVENEVMSA